VCSSTCSSQRPKKNPDPLLLRPPLLSFADCRGAAMAAQNSSARQFVNAPAGRQLQLRQSLRLRMLCCCWSLGSLLHYVAKKRRHKHMPAMIARASLSDIKPK
jgi:hypothetical protein